MNKHHPAWPLIALVIAMPTYALTLEETERLAYHPEASMVDAQTCEMRGASVNNLTKEPWPQMRMALFRKGNAKEPIVRMETREDGTYVVRFPARNGDVIVERSYVTNDVGRVIAKWGPHATCTNARVSVGELEQQKTP